MGFSGEPVNLPGYLERLDPAGLGRALRGLSRQYYREFWEAGRYRQGLLNAVGLAPLLAVGAWLAGRGVAGLARLALRDPPWVRRLDRLSGFPLMLAVGSLAVLWSLLWPVVTPGARSGWLLIPGGDGKLRLVQSLGSCPWPSPPSSGRWLSSLRPPVGCCRRTGADLPLLS